MASSYCDRGELDEAIGRLILDSLANNIQEISTNELRMLASLAKEDFIEYSRVMHGSAYVRHLCKMWERRELGEFVDEWVGLWIMKWRQRVRLMFSESGEDMEQGVPEDVRLISRRDFSKVKRLVKKALVENNEICGIDAISSFVTTQVIQDLVSQYGVLRTVEMIRGRDPSVVSHVISKVSEVVKSPQPLVVLFLRIDERRIYPS